MINSIEDAKIIFITSAKRPVVYSISYFLYDECVAVFEKYGIPYRDMEAEEYFEEWCQKDVPIDRGPLSAGLRRYFRLDIAEEDYNKLYGIVGSLEEEGHTNIKIVIEKAEEEGKKGEGEDEEEPFNWDEFDEEIDDHWYEEDIE